LASLTVGIDNHDSRRQPASRVRAVDDPDCLKPPGCVELEVNDMSSEGDAKFALDAHAHLRTVVKRQGLR